MIGAAALHAADAPHRAPDGPPLVWVNGRTSDPRAPQLSPLDRGFALGDALFETMRASAGRAFRLDAHLERLRDGARALAIPIPAWLDEHVRAALRDAAAAGLDEAAVRLTVSRGAGPAGVAAPPGLEPTIVLVVQPLPAFAPAIYTTGLAAITARARRNEHAGLRAFKIAAYAESIVALAEAREAGVDEAIFLDTAGHVAEATASNLFAVRHGAVVTPPVTCGALPGITRAAVIELAPALGFALEERPLLPDELAAADEAFCTSSLRGIAPLVRHDGRAIGEGLPGRATRALITAYADLLRREAAPS